MIDPKKITTHPVGRTIVLALGIFLGIILFATVFLKLYTHHGSTRAVPDVKNLSLAEATEVLEDRGMRTFVSDSVFQLGMKPGAVIAQNPKAGTKVKKNRKIYLTINAFQPEMIDMPNIVGVSRRQAKSLLESYGLMVGHIKYVPDIAFDNVLNQRYNGKDIASGTKIAKGSKVDLVLGRGNTGESAQVPDLTGMTLRTAQMLLTDSYLNMGITIFDKKVISSQDSVQAFIFKQKPSPDHIRTLRLGSYIDVWLTTDSTKLKKEDVPDENKKETDQ